MRGLAWMQLTGARSLASSNEGEFQRLVYEARAITEGPLVPFFDIIEKDLDRTFPHHNQFKLSDASGQVSHKLL
jgi:hypothetical protein